MAFNTGNPVGSSDPRDLLDNAQNFDEASIADKATFTDRRGATRRTYRGMELQFDGAQTDRSVRFDDAQTDRSVRFDGAQTDRSVRFEQFLQASGYVELGDYAAGLQITARNQVFVKDGSYWRPAASLSLPYTTSGSWAGESGNFVGLSDAMLRQELFSASGYKMVGGVAAKVHNIELLKQADFLEPGVVIETDGYDSWGDGGANRYLITSANEGVDDGGSYIDLPASSLQAKALFPFAVVSVRMFGAKGDGIKDDTDSISRAATFAKSANKAMYVPDGTYLVSDEIHIQCPIVGESKTNTIFHISGSFDSRITQKTKKWFTSNNLKFSPYEGTTKAVFNMDGQSELHHKNFTIRSDIFVGADSDLLSLPPVTGIRAGREGNLVDNRSTSRSSFENITIRGTHTAIDCTGFILNYSNISIFGAKNGIVASEWNNVNGSIIMESVQRAMQVYNGYQVNLTSLLNESHITCEPNILLGCASFYINGMYLEGNYYPNGVFRLGMTSDAGNVPISLIENKSIAINGVQVALPSQDITHIYADHMDGLEISGNWKKSRNSKLISRTVNSKNFEIQVFSVQNHVLEAPNQDPVGAAPVNYFPSPLLRNRTAGTYTYGKAFGGGDGVTHKTEWFSGPDNGVAPIGHNMLKLTTIDGSPQLLSVEVRRENYFPSEIREGDTVSVAVWVYVPKQGYRDTSVNGVGGNIPYLTPALFGDTVEGGSVEYMANYDQWCLYEASAIAPKNTKILGFKLSTSNGINMPAGTHIYFGGAFICKGKDALRFIRRGIYLTPSARVGDESGGNMVVNADVSNNSLVDSIELTKGDLITNPVNRPGAMLQIECREDGALYKFDNRSKFSPVGVPPTYDIPNTDPAYWGTCWLDNGALKINASTS